MHIYLDAPNPDMINEGSLDPSSLSKVLVRLNFINILLVLFRAKFACILAISNPVFRWKSCKDSVWESVKKCSRLCKEAGAHDWISRVSRGLQATRKLHTCQACQKLKSRASYCTTGQKSQAGQVVSSRLELATQPSREVKSPEHPVWEKLTFHIPSHSTIYIPLYPRYWESF